MKLLKSLITGIGFLLLLLALRVLGDNARFRGEED